MMLRTITQIISFTIVMFLSQQAAAVTTIDITRGVRESLPIAVNNFIGSSTDLSSMGADMVRVIEADLERSGLFRPIDKAAFLEVINSPDKVTSFVSWRQINATALVTGGLKLQSDNHIDIEFRLWDPYNEQQIEGQSYSLNPAGGKNAWRRVAHKIADAIYKRMTGEDGYFDTRIVYVAESGPGRNRVKRLAIMDQDGENHKFLTDGKILALTPRFAPSLHKILYLSFANKKPRVYLRDINSGKEKILGTFPGMTFAPRFAPDSISVALSMAYNGNTDIYLLNTETLAKTRLTSDPAIDVSPCFAPDGKKIVFTSDRGGSGQLYMMDADGGNVSRISFGAGSYSTPVWSPRGDYIAFTKKIARGNFYIGVMRPDGSGERILTEGYLVEGPSWSPNGRVIMFTRGEPSYGNNVGSSRIYSIDLTGYNEREIVTPIDASDPTWSPLLP